MYNIYFISGVNGVGKTSVMPYLRKLLSEDKFTVVDFDSRGVPDGADHAWRIEEARHWVEVGTQANGESKKLIVCGFVKPNDFADITNSSTPEVKILVLDADEDTIRKRLVGRYTKDGIFDENQKVIDKPIAEFINGNVWYAKQMREESKEDGLPVIDTSNITSEEVARKIVELILGQ